MKAKFSKLTQNIINIWLVILFGLTPIFFIPLTSEFYEFNKTILVSISAGILLILWFARSLLTGKFTIRTSKIDVAILCFALINILAASFSVDRYVSIAGWYPRFNHSLIFILSCTAIYFVTANNLTKKAVQFVLLSIYLSSLLLSIISLLNYFGVFLPMDYAQNRGWTPITGIRNLGFVLSITTIIGLYFSTRQYSASKTFLNYVFPVSLLPILLCFSLINILSAWIYLIIAIIIIYLVGPAKNIRNKRSLSLIIIAAIWLILTGAAYIPGINNNTFTKLIRTSDKQPDTSISFPQEVTLPTDISYSTTVGVLRNQNRALLGSGQGTFVFAYTQLKPSTINLTNNWNLRFDQPNAEIFMITSGSGILGLLAFSAIIVIIFIKALREFRSPNDNRYLSKTVLITLIILALSSLTTIYTATLTLFFFGLLGAVSSMTSERSELALKKTKTKINKKSSLSALAIPLALLTPSIIIFIFLTNFLINSFQAETHFQKSARATGQNSGITALQEQIAAIKENGSESAYRRQLIITDLALARSINQSAVELSQTENPDQAVLEQNQKEIASLITQAVEQGKIITGYLSNIQPGTSAMNVSNWEALSLVYRSLIGTGNNAEEHALKAQQQAIALDPQNPLLYINLGRTFLMINQTDQAVSSFEASIEKKPDYAVGYIALAEALKNRPNSSGRRAQVLNKALDLLPADSPIRQQITSEWEKALEENQKEPQSVSPQPTPTPVQTTPTQTSTDSASTQ